MGFFCQSLDLWVAGWYSEIEYIETRASSHLGLIRRQKLTSVPSTHRLPIPTEATTFQPNISLTSVL